MRADNAQRIGQCQRPPHKVAMHTAWMKSHPAALSTPHGRLRWARTHGEKKKYANASDAARAMGVSVPTYLGHENGSRAFEDDAPRYAQFFGVNLEWLMTGRGAPDGGDEIASLIRELPADKQEQALEYIDFLRGRKR